MLTVHMITLLRSVFDFGPPSSWWPSVRSEAKQDADDLTAFMIHRPNLLKPCGMSLSRYNKLMGACTPCTDDDGAIFEDPWAQIRGQVETFNTTRVKVVIPGAYDIHPFSSSFHPFSSIHPLSSIHHLCFYASIHPVFILNSSSIRPLFIPYSLFMPTPIHPPVILYSSSVRPVHPHRSNTNGRRVHVSLEGKGREV
jgi:hypothetical protein